MRNAEKYTHVSYLEHEGKYKGIWSWLLSTDHKKIGLLYLYSIAFFFVVAAILGLLLRLELIAPGPTIMDAQMYNGVFTLHGIIMVFIVVIPGLGAVFGNFFLPIMIGAKDVAFPRLNLLSWYIFIIGALLGVASQFAGDGPPDTGWTFYVPYSAESATNVIFALTAAFVLGFSSILTGINFIVTIHRMRAPGMGWFKMPLFPWSLYATAWIQVLATPIVGITLLMVIAERTLNIGFFDPALGGDPLLFQHLFWIYSHPAVYIMILPAMGVVTEIFPTFSQKPVFGYGAIVISSLAIAFVGYFVWGHHMFTTGISYWSRWFFSFLTFIVAIPSAIKVFNWISTMYGGSIDLKPPLLYAISFIFLFMIGGFTGLTLGAWRPMCISMTRLLWWRISIISFSGVWALPFSRASITGIPKCTAVCTTSNWPILPGASCLPASICCISHCLSLGYKACPVGTSITCPSFMPAISYPPLGPSSSSLVFL